MVNKCLTGKRFEGNVMGAVQFERTHWVSNGVTGEADWATDVNTGGHNHGYAIEFGKKINCNSYEVKINDFITGVALVKCDGSFVIKYCGTWASTFNALGFNYISEYNDDGFFTIRGKLNKCYTAVAIEVSGEYDSKYYNTFENNNHADSYCATLIESGLLKKKC